MYNMHTVFLHKKYPNKYPIQVFLIVIFMYEDDDDDSEIRFAAAYIWRRGE